MSSSASWPAETRARSAPCKRRLVRVARPVLALLLVAVTSPPPARPLERSSPVSWIQPEPKGESEEALAQALSGLTSAEALVGRLDALTRVAESHPATSGGGLARLASGFVLLEGRRFEEAITVLQHPDIGRTALRDYGLLALGRAREGAQRHGEAAQTFTQLIAEHPESTLLCSALYRRADALAAIGRSGDAIASLRQMIADCGAREPQILLRLGVLHETRGERREAAEAYDAVEHEHPASYEAREATRRLKGVRAALPPLSAPEKRRRDLERAQALIDAGRVATAIPILLGLQKGTLTPEEQDTVRARLARALVVLDRDKEAEVLLRSVPPSSPFAAEAAYHLARLAFARTKSLAGYETVVARFPQSTWAEEALYTLAFHYERDRRHSEALPYYRRLLTMFPSGRYVDKAAWAAAWWDFRHGKVKEAAEGFETAARERPRGSVPARFLYWAARARTALGDEADARRLYEETYRRFKHVYYGLRAGETLGAVRDGASSTRPAAFLPAPDEPDLPESQLTRIRQLLLIHQLDEAGHELGHAQPSSQVQATLAWIQWRAGRLRPAINAMKRAFPNWSSEDGDALPDVVWRILYPIRYQTELVDAARARGLDPALVAGVIWQESTFDTKATSPVGARGLMQIMPPTGRELARTVGVRFDLDILTDPDHGLRMGTLYLKQMIDNYGGRVERALAAYNAGPGRVRSWTAGRSGMSAEEFIENIPFTETRGYVMGILAHQEHYRRLYGLPPVAGRSAMANVLP